jgi:AcrR family transcriptional regulator
MRYRRHVTDDLDASLSPAVQRVRSAVVEAAATVLSRDEGASMQAVAEAAGVGRATLYRHFPSRETLMAALIDAAVTGAAEALRSANLDAVPADEAIARATRALLANAEHYAVVAQRRLPVEPEVARRLFADPLTAVLRRGQECGILRDDIDASLLYHCWLGMVVRMSEHVERLGVEDASSAVVRVLLDGARVR